MYPIGLKIKDTTEQYPCFLHVLRDLFLSANTITISIIYTTKRIG